MKQRGFTLLELLVTIAIMGIMAAIAMPSMSRFVENTRVINRTEQVANLFRFAKSEAVRMNAPVILCGTQVRSDGRPSGTCDSKQFSSGMMAFADLNRDGEYSANDDKLLRTAVINGNNTNGAVTVSLDACAFDQSQCGGKIVSGQFVFMPNGMFGYKTTTSKTTRSNFMSNTTLATNYVRIILDNKNTNYALAKLVIISPSGNTTTCNSGSENYQTYEKNATNKNRICKTS